MPTDKRVEGEVPKEALEAAATALALNDGSFLRLDERAVAAALSTPKGERE